ncbi:hypothetical protein HOY82DRAFT_359725 [Tuber indicum]|nr:hypothetical protein HOY82DRAFT_359725 [Tuber indicum]
MPGSCEEGLKMSEPEPSRSPDWRTRCLAPSLSAPFPAWVYRSGNRRKRGRKERKRKKERKSGRHLTRVSALVAIVTFFLYFLFLLFSLFQWGLKHGEKTTHTYFYPNANLTRRARHLRYPSVLLLVELPYRVFGTPRNPASPTFVRWIPATFCQKN